MIASLPLNVVNLSYESAMLCMCSYITDIWLSQLSCLPSAAIVSLNEFNTVLFEKVRTHFTGLSIGLYQYLHISNN